MKLLITKQRSTVFFFLTILILFATSNIGYGQAIDPLLSDRTPQVRDAIVAAVPDVNTADDVTAAHLAAITTLDPSFTGITSLKAGDFNGLTALTYLNLSGNSIGNISVLGNLTTLTTLYLAGTSISDISALENLTALKTLYLTSNSISDISTLQNLTALTELSLDENSVSDISVLKNLTALTTLILGKNSISDISALENLTALEDLYLAGNPISNYGPLRRLSAAIKADGRSLTLDITIPNNFIHRTPQVRDAIVAAVPGVSSANNVTAAHLAAITSLDIPGRVGNRITSLKAGDFDGLTALINLNLEFNNLRSLPSGIFDELTALETLILRGNRFTSLPSGIFDELTALKTLLLEYNALRSLPSDIFDELTALERLDLNNNGLSSLPSGIFDDLTALTYLNLGNRGRSTYYNNISDVSELEGLTSLTYLYLSGNPISDYGPLRRLKAAIVAAGGSLRLDITIPPEFTEGTSTTRAVAENTASGTNIGTAVAATDADGDTLIYTLGGTDAESFSIVSSSGQLQTSAALDYETKSSYAVTVSVFDRRGGRDSIDVTINVTNVIEPALSARTLQVRNAIFAAVTDVSSLGDVTAAHLAEITTLTIDNQGITSLRAGDFNELTGLTLLNLGNNTLSALPAGIFDELPALGTLFLHNNNISDVSELEGLTSLNNLFLSGNPISDYGPLRRLKAAIAAADRSLTLDITIPPEFIEGTSTTRSVPENTARGTNIGTPVAATDADGDTLTYSLGTNNDALFFSIVDTSGQLQTNAIFDYETRSSYTITVSVSDGNSGTDSITVTIDITDVDDPTPVNQRTQQVQDAIVAAIDEVNSADDVTAVQLTAITTLDLSNESITSLKSGDFDGLTGLTLLNLRNNTLSALPADIFDGLTALKTLRLRNNQISDVSELEDLTSLKTLRLSGNPISDYGPLLRLRVANSNISIDVDMTNSPPVFSDGDTTTRSVAENTAAGTNIGAAVSATDVDNHTLTYSLGGTDADAFDIVSTSGQLQTKAALDYETKTSYTVTVTVYDGNSGGDRITVTIDVTDDTGENDVAEDADENAPAAPSAETSALIPEKTDLLTNFPNPFNPETWIPYQLAKPAEVTLTIYDVRGLVVRELKLGHQAAGFYQSRSQAIYWDGRNAFGEQVATGVYFYTLKAGDFTATRKLLIRK